jgi:hypothetical protein
MNELTSPSFIKAKYKLVHAIAGLEVERHWQQENYCNVVGGVNYGTSVANLEDKTDWTRSSFQNTIQLILDDFDHHEWWVASRRSIIDQSTQTIEVIRALHHDSPTVPFDYDRVRAAIVHTTSRTRSGRPYQQS